jgi:transposase
VVNLLRFATVLDVASFLKVSWNLVKRIDKENLQRRYSKPKLKAVTHIAIDEFAFRKGHKYNTVVMDLMTGQVLFVGEGRSASTLEPFWKRLKASGAQIQAVAMDMWPAYIEAVSSNLPQAAIVYDRFHITRILNDHLSNIRRELYREEIDLNNRKLLKGTRWLLLKNHSNLNDEKHEKERLEQAIAINKPLAVAYYLKEELSLLWKQESVESARKFLGQWVAKAIASGISRLKQFAKSLLAHRDGIFNWYHHQISTGPLEGLNNKIKVLKRKAYGYRDNEYFKLKIYALHSAQWYAL